MFLVQCAASPCAYDRTGHQETSSSAAPCSARQNADSPCAWKRAMSEPSVQQPLPHAAADWHEGRVERSIASRHFAYAVGRKMVRENSGNDHEPNDTAGSRTENSIEPPAEENETVPNETLQQHHHIGEAPGELDESRICLLDTACTSCMHSKAWRVAYERRLPAGQGCEKTQNLKTFDLADGPATSGQVNVWRIPVVIIGRPGAIMSAEIETGTTPLLLSISAMEALGMSLFMKERMVLIGSLDVKVPMIKTRTKHLALDVTGSVFICT